MVACGPRLVTAGWMESSITQELSISNGSAGRCPATTSPAIADEIARAWPELEAVGVLSTSYATARPGATVPSLGKTDFGRSLHEIRWATSGYTAGRKVTATTATARLWQADSRVAKHPA